MTDALEGLKAHIGRSATASDVVAASAIAKLAATLGTDNPAPGPGDVIPPGWHCPFFGPTFGPSEMRTDGQAAGGGIVPPVPLPRRRLLGDDTVFHAPLAVGDAITCVSEVADISVEQQAGSPVVHLTLRQSISGPQGLAVVEDRRFFYLGEQGSAEQLGAEEQTRPPAWSRAVDPDPPLLFRFCALRFNSHRIHYDRDYATGVEGCPGLVVPGALIALLLLELCRSEIPGSAVAGFGFRAARPVYDTGPFTIAGAPADGGGAADLWVTDADGVTAMTAKARFKR